MTHKTFLWKFLSAAWKVFPGVIPHNNVAPLSWIFPGCFHHGSLESCGIMAETRAPFVDVLEAESQTWGQNAAITSGKALPWAWLFQEFLQQTWRILEQLHVPQKEPDLISAPLGCSGLGNVCLEPQTGIPCWAAPHSWCSSCNPKIGCVVLCLASHRWDRGEVWAEKDPKDPKDARFVFRLAEEVECAPGAAQRAGLRVWRDKKGGRKGNKKGRKGKKRREKRQKKKGKKAKLFSCGHPEGKGNAKPDLQRWARSLSTQCLVPHPWYSTELSCGQGNKNIAPHTWRAAQVPSSHPSQPKWVSGASTRLLGSRCLQEQRPACLVWVFCAAEHK